ncbi:hypothetical protein [Actinokineospora iranica]|uniref:Uncharacterized protein n=1 Tax=Actinokineospora iranica TaxID=1271860 RepID=A0A1G6LZV9_9PSEU|nr:hypothetical protein [Actinokineospora iranica]SDC48759.1 hypothetical protein SAMN05216174_102313 [Actinokineospora iranica]
MTTSQDPGTRLAEELVLLLAAVAERAGPWLDRVAGSTHAEHEQAEPGACQSCATCAFIALLRGESNDLAAKSIDRLADIVALLRAVLADRWEPGEPHMPGFRPEPPPSARVQHIAVRRRESPVTPR